VTAQDFNAVAADLGCPQVDATDGELLRAAIRRLNRCWRDRERARRVAVNQHYWRRERSTNDEEPRASIRDPHFETTCGGHAPAWRR